MDQHDIVGVMNISAWNIMQPLYSQRAIIGICKAIAHLKVVETYHGTYQSITLTCRVLSSALSEYDFKRIWNLDFKNWLN